MSRAVGLLGVLLLTACGDPAEPELDPLDPVVLQSVEAVGTGSVELTWTRSDAAEFSAYEVFHGTSAEVMESATPSARVSAMSETTTVLTGLDPFTTYYFVVFVRESSGRTAGSNERAATTWFHVSTFDQNLDGWSNGNAGGNLDAAFWIDYVGVGDILGAARLDGSDFGVSDGLANSWIYRELSLPTGVTTLRFDSSAHDRDGADSALRVRLIDAGQASHTILDWAIQSGAEGEFNFAEMTADISTWAGQTVTLYFEQGDNDVGIHEQRYLDNIVIR